MGMVALGKIVILDVGGKQRAPEKQKRHAKARKRHAILAHAATLAALREWMKACQMKHAHRRSAAARPATSMTDVAKSSGLAKFIPAKK